VSSLPPPTRVLTLLVACLDRGSISVDEAAGLLGIRADEVEAAAAALTGFGVPPFGPDDYLDVEVEDGLVFVHQDQDLGTPLRLSAVDGAMLLACLRATSPSFTGSLGALRARTADKLRDAIAPAAVAASDERAGAIAWSDEGGLPEGLVERLHRAVLERRELTLRYYNRSRDAVQARRAWPLRVVQHTGRWYLSAWAMPEDEHRLFRLDRVLEATPTAATFELDRDLPDVRVDVLFTASDERTRVEVRFPTQSAFRASRFFKTAQLVRSDDDGVVLALRGATLPLVLRQLFGFDEPWEVVAPPEARERVRRWCGGSCEAPMSHPSDKLTDLPA